MRRWWCRLFFACYFGRNLRIRAHRSALRAWARVVEWVTGRALALVRAPGWVWAQVWDLVVVRVARVLGAELAQAWAQVWALASALVAALERVEVQGWVLEGPV